MASSHDEGAPERTPGELFGEAMRAALRGVDEARAALGGQRAALARELDAAREARVRVERDGEQLAQQYLAGRREQLMDFSRQELLRRLARKHFEAGAPPLSIAA